MKVLTHAMRAHHHGQHQQHKSRDSESPRSPGKGPAAADELDEVLILNNNVQTLVNRYRISVPLCRCCLVVLSVANHHFSCRASNCTFLVCMSCYRVLEVTHRSTCDGRVVGILRSDVEKLVAHVAHVIAVAKRDSGSSADSGANTGNSHARRAEEAEIHLNELQTLQTVLDETNSQVRTCVAGHRNCRVALRCAMADVLNSHFLNSFFHSFTYLLFCLCPCDLSLQLKEKIRILAKFSRVQLNVKDFKFIRALGKGGFGAVYLAQRADNKKLCAVKVMSKTSIRKSNYELQILRERKALSLAARYPDYFVRLQCSFQRGDNLFLVMEYMPGGDCMTLLNSVHRLPEMVAQHIIAQVVVAVKHLHFHGVVHRDIKPDNVMVRARHAVVCLSLHNRRHFTNTSPICIPFPHRTHRSPTVVMPN